MAPIDEPTIPERIASLEGLVSDLQDHIEDIGFLAQQIEVDTGKLMDAAERAIDLAAAMALEDPNQPELFKEY